MWRGFWGGVTVSWLVVGTALGAERASSVSFLGNWRLVLDGVSYAEGADSLPESPSTEKGKIGQPPFNGRLIVQEARDGDHTALVDWTLTEGGRGWNSLFGGQREEARFFFLCRESSATFPEELRCDGDNVDAQLLLTRLTSSIAVVRITKGVLKASAESNLALDGHTSMFLWRQSVPHRNTAVPRGRLSELSYIGQWHRVDKAIRDGFRLNIERSLDPAHSFFAVQISPERREVLTVCDFPANDKGRRLICASHFDSRAVPPIELWLRSETIALLKPENSYLEKK